MPSRTSTLAGFTTSITSTTNLNAGIVTATSFVGNVTGTASTATAAATAYGLTGSPNVTVGSVTSGNINSSGVVTATTFSGNITGTAATFTGNVSIAGTLTFEDVTNVDAIGVITARNGIQINTGGLNVTAGISTFTTIIGTGLTITGISTALDTRLISVAEKSQILTGTTLSLVYNTGGSNIAIHTNPSADVTLAVTGIPTDSSFNNSVLTFSTVLINTGTARSCTAVTLNGVSASIKWFGGSLASAVSGVTTTSGTDIYTFTGINTVGSASTTTNYLLLGNVNGSYR